MKRITTRLLKKTVKTSLQNMNEKLTKLTLNKMDSTNYFIIIQRVENSCCDFYSPFLFKLRRYGSQNEKVGGIFVTVTFELLNPSSSTL